MTLNEYDQRQLELMLEHLRTYRNRIVDLPGLISGLESLRHLLTAVPDEWLERFWSAWGELEETYSIAVVREQPIDPLRSHPTIERNVALLEALVKELLAAASPSEFGR
jgi:hypothetical protein